MAKMQISPESKLRRFECTLGFERVRLSSKEETIEVPTAWAVSAMGHPDLLLSFDKSDKEYFDNLTEGQLSSLKRAMLPEHEIESAKDAIAILIPKPVAKRGRKPSSTKATTEKKE